MKMVGADLHIRPKVPFGTTATATRHLVLVPINCMAYDFICVDATRFGRACRTVEKVSSLHKLNHYVPYNL